MNTENQCPKCSRMIFPGEITWPPEAGTSEICQECWESECSRSWWEMVKALDDAGLLESPP